MKKTITAALAIIMAGAVHAASVSYYLEAKFLTNVYLADLPSVPLHTRVTTQNVAAIAAEVAVIKTNYAQLSGGASFAGDLSASSNLTILGNATVAGHIEGQHCGVYAFLTAPSTNAIATGGTYYAIGGTFSNVYTAGFGAAVTNTPGIMYTNGISSRAFQINWHASFSSANGETVSFGISQNGALCGGCAMSQFIKTANELHTASGTAVVTLSPNDEIQLMVSSLGGETVVVGNFTTSIRPFYW